MRRGLGILALVVLAACAPPAPPEIMRAPRGATLQEVFVATQHGDLDQFRNFGSDRQQQTRYFRAEVSIPPGHVPGQIETARQIDPDKHFALVSAEELARRAFIEAIDAAPNTADMVGIYVHGYNTSILKAGLRVTQLQEDFDVPHPLVAFAWPSSGEFRGYVYDRDSVLFARDGLEALIRQIHAQTGKKIMILAHSMGTHLTMEVLRQIALRGDGSITGLIDHVILVAPDIDPDVFRSQIAAIDALPQPFVVLSAEQDKALNFSGFLTGRRQRLGTVQRAPDLEARGVTFVDVGWLGAGGVQHTIPFGAPDAMTELAETLGFER
ncbi:MAG: alpha/beta hydrolase [Pseudomonadota bacterium]